MTKKLFLATLACSSFLIFSAFANSIHELGTIVPGTPADLGADLTRLQDLIGLYNSHPADGSSATFPTGPAGHTEVYTIHPGSAVPAPALPMPTAGLGPFTAGSGGSTLTLTLLSTLFDYLTVKWGEDVEAYYIKGLTAFTVPNDVNQNGWSGFELWNPQPALVPELTSTAWLLGAAAAGVALLRRKVNA